MTSLDPKEWRKISRDQTRAVQPLLKRLAAWTTWQVSCLTWICVPCTNIWSLLISNIFLKQNFIWNVFSQEIKLPFKVETIRFYGLEPSFSKVYYPAKVPVSGFWCEEFGETHFHSYNVFEISSTQKWAMDRNRWQSEGARTGLYAGCGSSSIPPNSWIFVMIFAPVLGLALSISVN